MKKISLYTAALFLFIGLRSTAQTTDDVLNVLIQKGTITQQDADSLRADAAIKQQDAKSKQKNFGLTASRLFQLSGYTQLRFQDYYQSSTKFANGFDIRRARLDLQGAISPKWDYRLQVDFVGSSAQTGSVSGTSLIAPTGGSLLSPTLLDAYAVYKPYTFLNVTAGQFLIPFSLENVTSDKTSETIDRSQVVNALVARKGDGSNGLVDSIGNQNGRDIGIQFSGSLIKIKDRNIVDYYVAYLNGAGINSADVNENKDLSARLVLHPIKELSIGGSYYNGEDRFTTSTTKTQLRTRWGTELSFAYKAFNLRSEFIQGQDGNNSTAHVIHQGWYAQASYFILPQKLQAVIKYDTYSVNKEITANANTYAIFGANYFFNNWSKIQANYSWRTEQGKLPYVNNDVFSLQYQISF